MTDATKKAANKALLMDILKTVFVLFLIAVIAGAILGVVNHFTVVDEMDTLKTKIANTGIYQGDSADLQVYNLSGEEGSISAGHEGVSHVFNSGNTYIIHCFGDGGYKGTVEVLVNITDGKITKAVCFASSETYTGKVFSDKYIANFYGKDLHDVQQFLLTKDKPTTDNEIKAIAGATKSSTAVLNALNNAVKWYLNAVEEDA